MEHKWEDSLQNEAVSDEDTVFRKKKILQEKKFHEAL